jgi:hypothetical protein
MSRTQISAQLAHWVHEACDVIIACWEWVGDYCWEFILRYEDEEKWVNGFGKFVTRLESTLCSCSGDSTAVLDEPAASELVKTFPAFITPEGSLIKLHLCAIRPYFELPTSDRCVLILSIGLRLDLPNYVFPKISISKSWTVTYTRYVCGSVTNNTTRVLIGYRINSLWRFQQQQITITANTLALVASQIPLTELYCADVSLGELISPHSGD